MQDNIKVLILKNSLEDQTFVLIAVITSDSALNATVFQDLRYVRNDALIQMVQESCTRESDKSPRKSTSVQRQTQIYGHACTRANTL